MMRSALFVLTCLCSLLSFNTYAADNEKPAITVVELFTSQGCYSCPPADTLLEKIDLQDNTITLSCHVTYWNYLGWKDTFSKSYCDNRQRVYQSALKGNRGVYTPQMVINGRYGAVGSRERTVGQAMTIMARENRIEAVDLQLNTSNGLVISLPKIMGDTAQSQAHQLILLGTTGTQTVPINRGENGGKTLDYHNPIAVVEHLGRWDGAQKTLSQAIDKHAGVKEWVVLAQTWPIGEIVAAGKLMVE